MYVHYQERIESRFAHVRNKQSHRSPELIVNNLMDYKNTTVWAPVDFVAMALMKSK